MAGIFAVLTICSIASVALCGCMSKEEIAKISNITPYQEAGIDFGYSEEKLSDTSYRVKATSTFHTLPERTARIALARAAQICVNAGFKYLRIDESKNGYRCTTRCINGSVCNVQQAIPHAELRATYLKETTPNGVKECHTLFAEQRRLLDTEVETQEGKMRAFNQAIFECSKRL